MQPFCVVDADVVVDSVPQLHSVLVSAQIDVLVFYAAPEPLDVDVVSRPSASVHADFKFRIINIFADQCRDEHLAGELAPLVGVEDFRPAVAQECARSQLFF